VLVTNEVGYGVVPPTTLGRTFRDLLGRLNQWVAAQADAVFLVVAGLGVEVKRLAVAPQAWARSVTAAEEHPD
jgi:adenosylcobinamide kinase/adenosylcobinamide-phosphate guanylyltransferase